MSVCAEEILAVEDYTGRGTIPVGGGVVEALEAIEHALSPRVALNCRWSQLEDSTVLESAPARGRAVQGSGPVEHESRIGGAPVAGTLKGVKQRLSPKRPAVLQLEHYAAAAAASRIVPAVLGRAVKVAPLIEDHAGPLL